MFIINMSETRHHNKSFDYENDVKTGKNKKNSDEIWKESVESI